MPLKAHFHFIRNSLIACKPLFEIRMRTGSAACERSQCNFIDLFAMFDFLRTFGCEPLSLIDSQSENNFTKHGDKGDTRYRKETDFHWFKWALKMVRSHYHIVGYPHPHVNITTNLLPDRKRKRVRISRAAAFRCKKANLFGLALWR